MHHPLFGSTSPIQNHICRVRPSKNAADAGSSKLVQFVVLRVKTLGSIGPYLLLREDPPFLPPLEGF